MNYPEANVVQRESPSYLELRDDPEYQLRALREEVARRVQEDYLKGIEPTNVDVEFLGD